MKNSDNKNTFENMPQALAEVFDEVYQVKKQLSELLEKFEPKAATELLTVTETIDLLKVNRVTLFNWHKKGTLIPFGIGARVYYRRSDIESALILLGNKKGTNNV